MNKIWFNIGVLITKFRLCKKIIFSHWSLWHSRDFVYYHEIIDECQPEWFYSALSKAHSHPTLNSKYQKPKKEVLELKFKSDDFHENENATMADYIMEACNAKPSNIDNKTSN